MFSQTSISFFKEYHCIVNDWEKRCCKKEYSVHHRISSQDFGMDWCMVEQVLHSTVTIANGQPTNHGYIGNSLWNKQESVSPENIKNNEFSVIKGS